MVKRVTQRETFHGTASGQAPNLVGLADRFGLSERQAQCMALLRMGTPTPDILDVLGISASTLETHLADLRGKFDVPTTASLAVHLETIIPDGDLDAFHFWPSRTNAIPEGAQISKKIADRMRTATSVERSLDALRDGLADVNVRHLYYCFLPHSVQGFLRGDILDAFLAPPEVEVAFHANGGLMGQPIAMTLFNAPGTVPVVPMQTEAHGQSSSLSAFYGICINDGASHIMALGFPSGPGFVGMAITFHADGDPTQAIAARSEDIRAAALTMHACMLTNGTLAARYKLTVRERDALCALALGQRASDAAAKMKISERAFAKLLASARTKLNARTNAEAVGKAAILNLLVFL